MNTKRLGGTDLELTSIGLGTWAIGGGGWAFAWGPQDDQDSIRTIHRALDLGINWIDTAPAYGTGHGEEIVGRALQGLSHKPVIATKCGRSWDPQRKLFPALKKEVIRSEVEASLKRLQVEVIDLYQIHWPQPDEDIEEAWTAIAEAIQQGKIRYGGVCNFNAAQLKRLQAIHPVASLQPPYSMIVRGVEDEALGYCAAQNIGVVAYSPMQKGLLTGKVTRERVQNFAEDDHRRRDPQFQEPLLGRNLELAEGLRGIAERTGRTVAQLAIAWVLRRPEVTSAIVGARQPKQIEEICNQGHWTLNSEDLTDIESLLAAREAAVKAAAGS